jgi:hypothetical protein
MTDIIEEGGELSSKIRKSMLVEKIISNPELYRPDVVKSEQIVLTPRVIEFAKQIQGEGNEFVHNIAVYIRDHLQFSEIDHPDFTRTADQILESGVIYGCQDNGAVMLAILRVRGATASFVQAFNRANLQNYDFESDRNKTSGHVFIHIWVPAGTFAVGKSLAGEEVWYIDSTSGFIFKEIPDEYVFGVEGADAWDAGLHSAQSYYDKFEEYAKKIQGLVKKP